MEVIKGECIVAEEILVKKRFYGSLRIQKTEDQFRTKTPYCEDNSKKSSNSEYH